MRVADPSAADAVARCFHDACIECEPASARFRSWLETYVGTLPRIAGMACAADRAGVYPHAVVDLLHRAGALRLTIPERFGGLGFGAHAAALVVEITAGACGASAAMLMFHYQVVRRSVTFADTNCCLQVDLERIAAHGLTSSSAWTEAGAGGDKTKTRTVVTMASDGRLAVSGEKTHCTGLHDRAVVHVLALSATSGGEDQLSFVRVEVGRAGAGIREIYDLSGLRAASTGTLALDGAACEFVGPPGSGGALMRANHQVLMNPGLIAIGIARRAHHECILDTGSRVRAVYGAHEAARYRLAEIENGLASSYALAAQLVRDRDASDLDNLRFKAEATDSAIRVVDAAAQLVGADAFRRGNEVERAQRDVRMCRMMGPLNEVIADRLSARSIARHEPVDPRLAARAVS